MSEKSYIAVISTGGTGGHIFPACGLLEILKNLDYNVELVSDKRGLTYFDGNFSKTNIKIISTGTIFQKNPFKLVLSSFLIFFAILKSIFYLRLIKPKVVFGMGGYSSFPICLASWILKIPLIIYENNLVIGKANKFLLPLAQKIFLSNLETKGIKEKYQNKVVYTGNILRKDVLNYKHTEQQDLNLLKILVLGGSQAAKVFGEKLPHIFKKCVDNNLKLFILQQSTHSQINDIKKYYEDNKINFELFTFRSNIKNIFKDVNLVITRAGASALAELISANIPFISIPLQNSVDNHQFENAKYYERNGCNFLINENEIDTKLFSLIKLVHEDKSLLSDIKRKQKNIVVSNIQKTVEKELKKIINEKI